jgi:hypothetical protein
MRGDYKRYLKPIIINRTVASAGAGWTALPIAPLGGDTLWLILSLSMYHTAGGDRTANWDFVDTTGQIKLGPDYVLPSGQNWTILTPSGVSTVVRLAMPLPSTLLRYPQPSFLAVGAAEVLYCTGVALEIKTGMIQ